ncbi:sulfurtransferase TusA family protein [Ancylobacter sp. 6x-1]|uniref:Sulfurtransferase TusA family protein n=1 Tax=Ancylobacter crimeensis TaxID=2579147 RepID=A0ABT0DD31_9HYPH|nr:sulfurtransferase TusA family protein [Ancylobacter crimeensis]MCK0197779.1 sulfurtransferase TusA family protein [Ancylobacter crimeensis]
MDVIHLDLKGLKCPLPALRTRRALERAAPGDLIEVVCTDPIAAIDIPHLVRQMGAEIEAQQRLTPVESRPLLLFRIRVAEHPVSGR